MTDTATIERATRPRRTPMTAPAPEPVPVETAAPAAVIDGPARSARKPFGTRQARLENNPIPGFFCYWFNDTPGRIDRAKEAGYEHVTDKDGKPVKKVVGVMEGGGPLHAYRMKLPVEFLKEDMAAKEAPRAAIDRQMREGNKNDGGYASPDRPGFNPEATSSATLTPEGRQFFGTKAPGA